MMGGGMSSPSPCILYAIAQKNKNSKKRAVKKIKNFLFRLSLFYLALYIPMAFMVYCPMWYTFNCRLHPGCEFIRMENAEKYIHELTGFFMHRGELKSAEWSFKEKFHLSEVRNNFDGMALFALICVILLAVTFNRHKLPGAARVNLIIVLSLLILIPFFTFFWMEIFHPLLFKNNFWESNRYDRSFYIMPVVFFKHSLVFLIASSSLINGLTWFISRKKGCYPMPLTDDQ
jgi:hypothetical protein